MAGDLELNPVCLQEHLVVGSDELSGHTVNLPRTGEYEHYS